MCLQNGFIPRIAAGYDAISFTVAAALLREVQPASVLQYTWSVSSNGPLFAAPADGWLTVVGGLVPGAVRAFAPGGAVVKRCRAREWAHPPL